MIECACPSPELGDRINAKLLGKKGGHQYTWVKCPECGESRWTSSRTGLLLIHCRKCADAKSIKASGAQKPNWKGGEFKTSDGYILVVLSMDSPYRAMICKNGYVRKHRLVMAQHLGRCLLKLEHVHHRNGIKSDNRIENLELISPTNHALRARMCSSCELRKEIRLLRWQIKELTKQLQERLIA